MNLQEQVRIVNRIMKLEERIAALEAQIKALREQQPEPEKRGPGRPRKQ